MPSREVKHVEVSPPRPPKRFLMEGGLPNATASELSSLPVPAPLPRETVWVHTEEFMFVPPGFPL